MNFYQDTFLKNPAYIPNRLKADLERVCVDQEERAQQQALRHTHDMAALRDQLAEAESVKSSLQNEVRISGN